MQTPTKSTEPIPGYVVKERIGVGGYGEVWSAQAPGDLTKAIKFVYGYFDDNRAARELKALNRIKQVRHPFLLSLERFEVVDGQLIIVTELADMSLKDRFEKVRAEGRPGIARDELLGYMRDAADALDYMRENFALQHLDVKPENMLLVGGRVKVADFGLVKELQDHTASLMGGLTPIYASPEVFDDRPSEYSDQYSLAIVYQEMLTGQLPFPGRTPAQLASQHLHARPRLAPLPHDDQAVVARALDKDPHKRYPSCRALIDNLLSAGRDQASAAKAGSEPRATVSNASLETSHQDVPPKSKTDPTLPRREVKPKTDPTLPRRDGKPKTDPLLPKRDNGTVVIGAPVTSEPASAASPVSSLPPAGPTVQLPPVEVDSSTVRIRPTLFVGIGGTGARTLRHLRRRLSDRLGGHGVPVMELLLLDTDSKAAFQATQGDPSLALSDSQILPLPLRNAHDYTSSSRNILQWLSRRWLYNIPRSLQTEGRRPLGRLALMDHAPQVIDRLRRALTSIASEQAIAEGRAAGIEFANLSPRVYVISSLSGGTGGGMVLDVAYAVRKLLAELGHDEDQVFGLLTHSTDRNPATHDLSLANTYACLSELNHYSGSGGYPGEAACGLPPVAGEHGPFAATHFIHLGNDLNDGQFQAATHELATYLFLDSVTPAATTLEHCRKLPSPPGLDQGQRLRSFGVTEIGSEQTPLAELAAELVCQEVVDRWRGATKQTWQSELPATPAAATSLPQEPSAPIEQRASAHFQGLALSVPSLSLQARQAIEAQRAGDAETILGRVRAAVESGEHASANSAVRMSAIIQAIHDEFLPPLEQDITRRQTSSLLTFVEQALQKIVAPRAREIRQWIVGIIDDPAGRVGAACRARQWYAGQIQNFESQCADMLHGVQLEIHAIEQSVLTAEKETPERPRFFGSRKAEKNQVYNHAALLRIIELRGEETALIALAKATRVILSEITAAGDEIKDVQRTLSELSTEFSAAAPWGHSTDEAPPTDVADQVRAAVSQRLRQRMAELAVKVDRRAQQFLAEHGSLRELCKKADTVRTVVPAALRSAARQEVVEALKQISIAEPLLGTDSGEGQLQRIQKCLARPRIENCGGAERLVAVLPESTRDSQLPALLGQLSPPATVLFDADADLILVHELQDLQIPHVAQFLLDGRQDLVQVAARLHTRIDVGWTPMS